MKKARLLTVRRSENEYEIVEFDIPKEYRDKGIEDELLKKVTDNPTMRGLHYVWTSIR